MTIQPPGPERRPHVLEQHGPPRIDDYYWMRDREDPKVSEHLKQENEYLQGVLAGAAGFQEKLFHELKSRIQESDLSVPEGRGEYLYYTRMEPGKQYPIYCRKRGSLEAPEQVILDQNELAKGRPYCSLGAFEISPDHAYLAYSADFDGSEIFTIFLQDLETGQLLPEQIERTISYMYMRVGLAWAEDGRTLFYTTFDATMRPDKVYRHVLGSDPAGDACIFHEPDQAFYIYLSKSRSREYILLNLTSQNGTELHYLPASQPQAEPRLLLPRRPKLEYYTDHLGDAFFIAINEDAPNFKLMSAPVGNPARENWQEILPHREDVLIESVDAFQDYLVLVERKDGLKQVRIAGPDGRSQVSYVDFPEPAYNLALAANPEFSTHKLRFTYSSLVTPNSVVEWDMQAGRWELKKQDEIPSGYEPDQYTSERLYVPAPDGKRVPLSLVYRKDLAKDGQNPLLLAGYGAYGSSIDPTFNPNRLSLLDRGFVFAIAHIRGGSEMGRAWYEEGRLLNKRNSFTDFITCAEHLIAAGYTSSRRLAIHGGSAGGLLVGAVMTMRPDLFKAVVAQVPFVDVVTTMSDPSIPLTVIEYDQWGNPAEKEFFDYMMSYSPYDNLRPGPYPDLLATTGFSDPRVAFWEPAKFVAKLRTLTSNNSLALLKTNFDAGHFGASGRYEILKEVALIYAFLCDRLGVALE